MGQLGWLGSTNGPGVPEARQCSVLNWVVCLQVCINTHEQDENCPLAF